MTDALTCVGVLVLVLDILPSSARNSAVPIAITASPDAPAREHFTLGRKDEYLYRKAVRTFLMSRVQNPVNAHVFIAVNMCWHDSFFGKYANKGKGREARRSSSEKCSHGPVYPFQSRAQARPSFDEALHTVHPLHGTCPRVGLANGKKTS